PIDPLLPHSHLHPFPTRRSSDLKTPAEIAAALDRLGAHKLQGLILDLRDNPGGLVNSAVETASLFLNPDTAVLTVRGRVMPEKTDRKSTRLNSSHQIISYAVFCL